VWQVQHDRLAPHVLQEQHVQPDQHVRLGLRVQLDLQDLLAVGLITRFLIGWPNKQWSCHRL
jgi:hypothetical protein